MWTCLVQKYQSSTRPLPGRIREMWACLVQKYQSSTRPLPGRISEMWACLVQIYQSSTRPLPGRIREMWACLVQMYQSSTRPLPGRIQARPRRRWTCVYRHMCGDGDNYVYVYVLEHALVCIVVRLCIGWYACVLDASVRARACVRAYV